jgi:hypothetical protein
MKTRLWESETTNTCVQFRDDFQEMVGMHTNLGWIPLGRGEGEGEGPWTADEAEKKAESIAEAYNLVESPPVRALFMAGMSEIKSLATVTANEI